MSYYALPRPMYDFALLLLKNVTFRGEGRRKGGERAGLEQGVGSIQSWNNYKNIF